MKNWSGSCACCVVVVKGDAFDVLIDVPLVVISVSISRVRSMLFEGTIRRETNSSDNCWNTKMLRRGDLEFLTYRKFSRITEFYVIRY